MHIYLFVIDKMMKKNQIIKQLNDKNVAVRFYWNFQYFFFSLVAAKECLYIMVILAKHIENIILAKAFKLRNE